MVPSDGALTHGPLTTPRVARIAKPEHPRGAVELKQGADILYSGGDLEEAFGKIPDSGSYEITLSPGSYDVVGLTYKGSATIRIRGTGTARYGMDVLIHGRGIDMSKEALRNTLSFQGACNIIMENVVIQNTYGGDGSAEALGVGDTNFFGTLAARNCAFISTKHAICTDGKAWFYDCYIEGDSSSILWMERYSSKVALYENCRIRATSGRADRTYFTNPRLSVTNTVGKGLVIWKSTLEAESGFKEVYLGYNSWDKAKDEADGTNRFNDYYENVAIVGTKYYGPALNGAIWYGSGANGTENQQFVGFKTDSNFASSSTGLGARLTAAQVSAEYSDRNAILNRVYNIVEEKFENDTASGIWDIAALEAEFGAGASGGLEQDVFNPKSAKVTWDLASEWKDDDGNSSITGYIQTGVLTGAVSGSDEHKVKMHINANANWQNGKFEANLGRGRTQINRHTVLTVPVTNGSIVSVSMYNNTGTFVIEGETTTTYTHSGGATEIIIYCSAEKGYLTEVTVSKLDLTALSDDLKNATAEGSTRVIALGDSAKEIMNGNSYRPIVTQYTSYGAPAGKVEWTSSDESVAYVDADGTVTAKSDHGTAIITATVNGHSATYKITAKPKTEVSKYTFDFRTASDPAINVSVSAEEDSSKSVYVKEGDMRFYDLIHGACTVTINSVLAVPVFANCTITVYQSFRATVWDSTLSVANATPPSVIFDLSCDNQNDTELEKNKYVFNYSGPDGMTDLTFAYYNMHIAKIVVEKTN